MTPCLLNGELAETIAIDDRGLLYGDGVFETIRVSGGQPQFWQGHMERLAAGCERLALTMPHQAVLLREVHTMAAGMPECIAKIVLTRGSAPRGYQRPERPSENRIVAAFPLDIGALMDPTTGIEARICRIRLGLQPALAGIKHLNRLEQVLASSESSAPGVREGILLDQEDFVICGIASNIFLVSGDRILTPRLDRCGVKGVIRGKIVQAFKSRCELRRVGIDMLPEAEEVFICNSVQGVIPVRTIDNWEFEIGPVTREVQAWLQNR